MERKAMEALYRRLHKIIDTETKKQFAIKPNPDGYSEQQHQAYNESAAKIDKAYREISELRKKAAVMETAQDRPKGLTAGKYGNNTEVASCRPRKERGGAGRSRDRPQQKRDEAR